MFISFDPLIAFLGPLSSTPPQFNTSVQLKRAIRFQPPKFLSSTPKTPKFNTPLSSSPKIPQLNTRKNLTKNSFK